jgi:competence protein ComEA
MPEEFLYKFRWQILLVLVGLGFAGAGLLMTRLTLFAPAKVEILGEEDAADEVQGLVVEVSGSVAHPGVYELEAGSRVEDALESAGGLTDSANYEWLEKSLNRAAKIADGQKIYIPDESESDSQNVSNIGSTLQSNSGMVNVNTASSSQLEALRGIGPVTADKIIENRPYLSVEELLSRKILRSDVYEENRDKFTI